MGYRSISARLCVMMFLEYAVRGMWFPFLANYLSAPRGMRGLGFTPGETGWILGFANALGAFTAPLVAGRIADRYFNAERALAVLHCIAAVLLFVNASTTTFVPFFLLMICFSIAYVPTQSLANSLAMYHLTDREHSYPRTRMWGTVGWIITSGLFTYVVLRAGDRGTNIARIPYALRGAAMLAVGYAGYAYFILPATPPGDRATKRLPTAGLLAIFRERSVLILTLVAMPIACIHTAYYLNIGPFLTDAVGVPLNLVGPTLAVSQTSELVFLFLLGKLLRRFGYRWILTLGAAAQALRFVVFAINPGAAVVIVSLALHGVAFACFQTSAILYVERVSPARIRHTVQTVFGIVLFGLGPALAGPYSQLFDRFVKEGRPDFRMIWWTQAGIAIAAAGVMYLLFRERQVGVGKIGGEEEFEA